MKSTLCGLLMVFAGATMALAQLQQQPPSEPDDGLDALRTKDPLSDEDRGTLRAWIGERIAAVVGGDAGGAQQAVAQLRHANRGGRGFLDAFGAAAVESIGSAYKKAELAPATRMITIVGELNDPLRPGHAAGGAQRRAPGHPGGGRRGHAQAAAQDRHRPGGDQA